MALFLRINRPVGERESPRFDPCYENGSYRCCWPLLGFHSAIEKVQIKVLIVPYCFKPRKNLIYIYLLHIRLIRALQIQKTQVEENYLNIGQPNILVPLLRILLTQHDIKLKTAVVPVMYLNQLKPDVYQINRAGAGFNRKIPLKSVHL